MPTTKSSKKVASNVVPPEVLANEFEREGAAERETAATIEKLVRPDAVETAGPNLSERTDKTEPEPTIGLLSDAEKSEAEQRLLTQQEITESWRRIEKLMRNETANAWSLGDEFKALTEKEVGTTRITIREIADKVQRGKSYVDSLLATSEAFPKGERLSGFTWFCHDLYRRGFKQANQRMGEAGIRPTTPENVTEWRKKAMQAIVAAKARNTKDVVNVIATTMGKEKLLDAEQVKTLLAKPEGKPELQLMLAKTAGRLNSIEVVEKPPVGANTYSGWNHSKLAWKALGIGEDKLLGVRAIIIPIKDEKPLIDAPLATLLLGCANGDEKALAEFAEKAKSRRPAPLNRDRMPNQKVPL